MKLNLNKILIILGGLGVFAPDLAFVASWLGGMHVAWLGPVVRALGLLAAFCSAAPLVVPRLRSFLALLGLATPPGAQAPWIPAKPAGAVPAQPADPTPLTIPIRPIIIKQPDARDPQKGSALSSALMLLGVFVTLLALLTVIAYARPAQAQQFGGCLDGGRVCLGPSATVSVGQFNLTTSKFSGGVVPGVGYGVTLAPDQWYATGAALYASFLVGQGQPAALTPSLMFSFANYVRLGAGVAITEQSSGPTSKQWLLLFGLGSDFGGSPGYVKSKLEQAARP